MDEVPNQETQSQPQATQKSGIAVKTLLLIIVLAIIASGLLWIALGQNSDQTVSIKQIPTVTPDPVQTTLTISSVPIPLATPSAYRTDVIINTGQDKINSVQLELSYDPKVLTNVNIEPGSFFVDPKVSIKNIDKINGRITFALGPSGPTGVDNGVLGQGIVAIIKFSAIKTKTNSPVTISFLPKTQVLGDGYSTSLLKTTIDSSFILVRATPTPTATRSASPGF